MKSMSKINLPRNGSVLFAFATGLGIVSLLLFPFGIFYLSLSLVVLATGECRVRRFVVLILCVTAVIVLAPLVALKLPIDVIGNDKSQYLGFMYEMNDFGMKDLMARQPEIISFASLYMTSHLVGATDLAFYVIFVTFFSLLLVVIWCEQYNVIPLFMLLLISSSPFFSVYGNVIRQGMALPFIFLMIFSNEKKKAALWLVMSGLAHIPALLIGAPYVLYRCFGKWATWSVLVVASGICFFLKMRPGFMDSLSSDDTSYVSKKINLYSNWDKYSIAGTAALALAIFLLCNFIRWKGVRRAKRRIADEYKAETYCLVAINFSFVSLLATYDFSKIFERIYIYFFVIVLMYLSLVIGRMKSGLFRKLVVMLAMAYGIAAFTKNLTIQPLLYRGDPFGFLTASIFEMYRHLM